MTSYIKYYGMSLEVTYSRPRHMEAGDLLEIQVELLKVFDIDEFLDYIQNSTLHRDFLDTSVLETYLSSDDKLIERISEEVYTNGYEKS